MRAKNVYCLKHFGSNQFKISSLYNSWVHRNSIQVVYTCNEERSLNTCAQLFPETKVKLISEQHFRAPKNIYKLIEPLKEYNIALISNEQNIHKFLYNDNITKISSYHPYLLELTFKDLCNN